MSESNKNKPKMTEGWLVSGPKDEVVSCFVVYQREHVEIILQALHEANKISDPDDFTATEIDHVCIVAPTDPASVVQDDHHIPLSEGDKKQAIGRYYREAITNGNPSVNMRFGLTPTLDLIHALTGKSMHETDGYKFGNDLRAALESGPTSTEDPPVREQGTRIATQELLSNPMSLNLYGSADHFKKVDGLEKSVDKHPSMTVRFDIVDKKS